MFRTWSPFQFLGLAFSTLSSPPRLCGGGGLNFLVDVNIHLDVTGDADVLRARDYAAAGRDGGAGRTVLIYAPLIDLEGLLLSPEI